MQTRPIFAGLIFAAPLLAGLLLAAGPALAAEQLDNTYRITAGGLVSFTALAALPQRGGTVMEVFEWKNQPDVCADAACIGLERWSANAAPVSSRVKAAALLSVKAATVDSRGRIIVIGETQGPGADGADFGIVRFRADGSDDTSFAGDGGTRVGFNLGQGNNDYPLAVAVDAEDNIIVAGSVQRSSVGDTDFGVIRLRADDGSLDTRFSGDGRLPIAFDLASSLRIDQANAVAVRNDGKIVVAGIALDGAISRTRVALAQINADGTLDSGFCNGSCNFNGGYSASNGRRVYYFGTSTAHADEALGLDVASSNDIAVVGTTYSDDGATRRAAIARFNAAGQQTSESLEPGLADNGRFTSVRFADGLGTRIIAAGDSGPGPNYFLVQAFTATLARDSSYGNCLDSTSALCFIGGSGIGDTGPNQAGQINLDSRGRPYFAGTYRTATNGRLLLQRISNNSGPKPDRIFRSVF
jgi:uncharacterized delta-60 repeat protein